MGRAVKNEEERKTGDRFSKKRSVVASSLSLCHAGLYVTMATLLSLAFIPYVSYSSISRTSKVIVLASRPSL